MPAELSPSLLQVLLSRTLEEAAFVFFEPAAHPPELEEPLIEAKLRYLAEHARGELRLVVSEAFASVLAANMLGEEEGGAAVTGDDEDAVGELLNMVAGAVTLELFGRYARCTLGVPEVSRISAAKQRQALAVADEQVTLVDEEGRRVDFSSTRMRGGGR